MVAVQSVGLRVIHHPKVSSQFNSIQLFSYLLVSQGHQRRGGNSKDSKVEPVLLWFTQRVRKRVSIYLYFVFNHCITDRLSMSNRVGTVKSQQNVGVA